MAWLAQNQPLLLAAQLPYCKLTSERFWIPIQTKRCRRWRPANFRGHSVSSALPCISFRKRAVGAAGTFQRGKSPNRNFSSKTRFSTAQPPPSRTETGEDRQHTASLDELAEPIYYNKHVTHRQLVFLHPTFGVAKTIPGKFPAFCASCLIPTRTSTLQVFQFILMVWSRGVPRGESK
jgi:hypothetical protein